LKWFFNLFFLNSPRLKQQQFERGRLKWFFNLFFLNSPRLKQQQNEECFIDLVEQTL